MEWRNHLKELSDSGLQGLDLLSRHLERSHNAPGLPPHAWDGDDIGPLLRRLNYQDREQLGMPPAPTEPPPAAPRVPQAQPVYTIRVHVICCANDDGTGAHTNPATVNAWMPAAMAEANAIYSAKGAGIELTFIPGDVEVRKSTLLNQDYLVPAGTNMHTGPGTRPLTDDQIQAAAKPHEDERNKVCKQYRDRCVFLLSEGTNLAYDEAAKVWKTVPRTYAYSWTDKEFVNFPSPWGALRGPEVAHESGHYFGLWHTHGSTPKTAADAAKVIASFVNGGSGTVANGLDVFDGDRGSGVNDTPPDPGPDFFKNAAPPGTPDPVCGIGSAPTVKVTFATGTSHTYAPAPDRGDVMSYFKDCSTFAQHFSPDQITRMRTTIRSGVRRRLVATQLGDTSFPNVRYGALWDQGTQGQVWWPLCTEQQLRAKADELWGGMRFRQMIAVPVGNEIRYACLWEPGTYAQVWWPSCTEKQFRDKTGELWGTMRPAQVQPFLSGGEVRFSCIWNAGTQAQVWWPLCTEQQLRAKADELWKTMRFKQMLALQVGSEVRFACLWEPGTDGQVWWPNCTEQQFRDKTGELWASMRPSQLQPFSTSGQVHFSAIWNPDVEAQVWWPQCTEEQTRQKTDDLWSSMRPAGWWPAAV